MKKFLLILLLTVSFSLVSTQEVDARVYRYAHIYDNGCVGIRSYHSYLWGAIQYVTDEYVACP